MICCKLFPAVPNEIVLTVRFCILYKMVSWSWLIYFAENPQALCKIVNKSIREGARSSKRYNSVLVVITWTIQNQSKIVEYAQINQKAGI